ncbi:hypothetical protein CSB62_12190 [Vibrio splendidus]|uniref:Fimbrial protein n=1 Tax=Vibrio lentus TaxID=136468 RepID=A0A855IM85_9VIBR|nr:hypothetical protein [Vibrio lentus]PHN85651.1 hypothetical protein CSB62_12190 [Vibrio splendidus]MCB5362114.1 hypothetical protein [Vibrio lentus]MCB5452280.1 hypothetical protein [Vibrio lentus]MCB5464483.1 hypothetical protein [Vibrio lentus]MCC4795123.1 hypothetical protein [Vibrio lentus]
MKKLILVLMLVSMNTYSASKVLNVTTNIDIINLYSDAITSVEFIPSVLELIPTSDNKQFDDISTTLKIATDIPKDRSAIGYLATLTKNESFCTDFSGVTNAQIDFVSVMFDGLVIANGDSISVAEFNSDDGTNKYSEHDMEIAFKPFKDITTTGQPERCNGEIEFSIEVDI